MEDVARPGVDGRRGTDVPRETIASVRSFNRAVVERVGALEDHYLDRGRPLGASRLLWEIGDRGSDVRALRARLGLDAGYVSRLLRSLVDDGLVDVTRSAGDGRVRTATLTTAGREERAVLDARSDDLARSFLDPLGAGQQARLVEAMGEVERLLTAGLVAIAEVDPADPRARHCIDAYQTELDRRLHTGYDPTRARQIDDDEMRAPAGAFLLATLRDAPVGCGALRFTPGAPAEIKRMWVDPDTRGLGVGRRLMDALEARVADQGSDVIHLDTNGALTEAIGLYRSRGYVEVVRFNDEVHADHWFEKRISGRTGAG
jgi:DNA-binding MarR family transcriptional regulator/GNAT superfamily N-acetyltransferase